MNLAIQFLPTQALRRHRLQEGWRSIVENYETETHMVSDGTFEWYADHPYFDYDEILHLSFLHSIRLLVNRFIMKLRTGMISRISKRVQRNLMRGINEGNLLRYLPYGGVNRSRLF